MRCKSCREFRKCNTNFFQCFQIHGSIHGLKNIIAFGFAKSLPKTFEFKRFDFRRTFFSFFVNFLDVFHLFIEEIIIEFLINDIFSNQLFAVNLTKCGVLFDDLVHLGLSVGRFVTFVVSKTTIAHHIDHDVTAPLLTEFQSDVHGSQTRFCIIPIHMNDWSG